MRVWGVWKMLKASMGNRAAVSKDVCCRIVKGLKDQTEVWLLSRLGGALDVQKLDWAFKKVTLVIVQILYMID